jgi:hypothetical protein
LQLHPFRRYLITERSTEPLESPKTMKLKSFIRIPAGLKLLAAATLGLSAMNARAGGNAPDLDGDGVPNIVDPDVDGDGMPNSLDENVDGGIAKTGPYAGQYVGDHVNNDNPAESDIDDDGLSDDSLGETDTDGDSKSDSNAWESDTDGDGRSDTAPAERDMDGDGRLDDDSAEDDIDGDSLDDDDLAEGDIDGDNSSDSLDDDIDGDTRGNNVLNDDDVDGDGRLNTSDDEEDDDGDGAHDRDDDDDNNDGVEDHDDDDHHDEDDEIEQKVNLTPGAAATSGSSARVELQSMATGKLELKIRGNGMPAGDYGIVIGGVVRGTLKMRVDEYDDTRGKIEFETGNIDDDELPLNFPVAGEALSIVQGGNTWFSGTIPTPPAPPVPGDDDHHDHTFIQILTRAAGVPVEAKAEAEIDVGLAGVIVFEVEVEGIEAGTYEVTVGGIPRGSITVVAYPDRTRGELRFETEPEGPEEILLDFPVVGLPVTITQGTTLYFSGTVPGGE